MRLLLECVYTKCVGSAAADSVLDKEIDAEDAQYKDFFRLVRLLKQVQFSRIVLRFFLDIFLLVYFRGLFTCRIMSKDITNCLQKPKYSFPVRLQSGMLSITLRLMMMFMSTLVPNSISSIIFVIFLFSLS